MEENVPTSKHSKVNGKAAPGEESCPHHIPGCCNDLTRLDAKAEPTRVWLTVQGHAWPVLSRKVAHFTNDCYSLKSKLTLKETVQPHFLMLT